MSKMQRLLYFNKMSKGAWIKQLVIASLAYCILSTIMIFIPKYAVTVALASDYTKPLINVMILLTIYLIASMVMAYSEKKVKATANKIYRDSYEIL